MTRLIAVAFALTLAASARPPRPSRHCTNSTASLRKPVTPATQECTWSTVSVGRPLCAARPAGAWYGVQGTFAVSGGETVTSQEGCVIQAALEIFAVSQYRGLRSRVVRMC